MSVILANMFASLTGI